MGKIKLIAIIGKAGSGKNTILKRFVERSRFFEANDATQTYHITDEQFRKQFNIVVPFTTRPMREGEVDGQDYYFINKDKIGAMIEDGSVAQVEDFRGWLYGTLWSELKEDRINIGIFNPRAVDYLNDYVDLDITTVYIMAPDKDRLLRQLEREDNPDVKEIVRRYGTDEEDFAESELQYLPKMHRIDNPNVNCLFTDDRYVDAMFRPHMEFLKVVASVKND